MYVVKDSILLYLELPIPSSFGDPYIRKKLVYQTKPRLQVFQAVSVASAHGYRDAVYLYLIG
jgi:hypothetical protein